MIKQLRTIALMTGLGLAPLFLAPVPAQAQQSLDQRAYQNGYQNGANAATSGRPMNMNTDDWQGDRLAAYQQGYRQGYESVSGNGQNGQYGRRDNDHDRDDRDRAYNPNGGYGQPSATYGQDYQAQRAYQNGYQNGENAARSGRPMNLRTDDWQGSRLQAYRQGYEQGYNRANGNNGHHKHHDRDHDDDDR